MPDLKGFASSAVRYRPDMTRVSSAATKGLIWVLMILVVLSAGLSFLYIDPRIAMIAALSVFALLLVTGRPENSLLLLIALMPLMDMYNLPIVGVNLKVSDWVGIVSIGLFLLRYPFDRTLSVRSDPLRLPILTYIFFGLVSSVLTYQNVLLTSPVDGASGLNSPQYRTWMQLGWGIYSFLLYMMVYRLARTRRILMWSIAMLLISSLGVGIYAVSGLRYWMSDGGIRLLGTFSEPSYYAEWLVMVIPIAIALMLANQWKLSRLVQAGFVLFLIINLLMTVSTGGYVSGFLALLVMAALAGRQKIVQGMESVKFRVATVGFFMSLVVGLIILMPNASVQFREVMTKITDPESSSHSSMVRKRLREAAKSMFMENHIWGVGPGNYPFYRLDYMKDEKKLTSLEKSGRWDCNNLYLEVLSERGLVGAAFFIWIWLAFYYTVYKAIKNANDDFCRAALIGMLAGSVGLLIGYYAHANFYRIFVWVYLGLAMAAVRLSKQQVSSNVIASPGVEPDEYVYRPSNKRLSGKKSLPGVRVLRSAGE